ncbi:putative hydroxypyruvate isomerase [Takifugu flavidus]|uniref:Putative hydroxypyruvate isomerase n=1 Tax=Takifugu flavidus TaxID=433684 RepID=A0A5C6MR77_9TELE|nr:putative hydroxypyruvate isomerase [Takifugu flavidus]
MAPLRFCANISWLFTELPDFSKRIYAAAAAGFQAVEAAWLYDCDLSELQRAREATGVEVVLINTPPGDVQAGDLGLGAVPGREAEFRQGLDLALDYARSLSCKRIHLMAGRVPVGSQRSTVARDMENTFIQNLRYAADVLSKEGMTGLIEPINSRITDPRYYLDSPHQDPTELKHAVLLHWENRGGTLERDEMTEEIRGLKQSLACAVSSSGNAHDIFHCQIMDGNLSQNLQKYLPIIAHIQIAQVPDRNEPDSAGELNYSFLFSTLEKHGYQGYIGCEYKPLGSTKEGLGWLSKYTQQATTTGVR